LNPAGEKKRGKNADANPRKRVGKKKKGKKKDEAPLPNFLPALFSQRKREKARPLTAKRKAGKGEEGGKKKTTWPRETCLSFS